MLERRREDSFGGQAGEGRLDPGCEVVRARSEWLTRSVSLFGQEFGAKSCCSAIEVCLGPEYMTCVGRRETYQADGPAAHQSHDSSSHQSWVGYLIEQ